MTVVYAFAAAVVLVTALTAVLAYAMRGRP